MTEVYVVGVDMIKFGRFPDRTVPNLGAEAALMALDDAGLTIKDMQALYCGNLGQASGMVGQRVLQEIGQTGIPVVNTANACATLWETPRVCSMRRSCSAANTFPATRSVAKTSVQDASASGYSSSKSESTRTTSC